MSTDFLFCERPKTVEAAQIALVNLIDAASILRFVGSAGLDFATRSI